MLFRVWTSTRRVSRIEGRQLRDFKISERDFQAILFENIERFLPDEELLTIAHSRNWQEEPDILALDRKRRLFIFELKVGSLDRKISSRPCDTVRFLVNTVTKN